MQTNSGSQRVRQMPLDPQSYQRKFYQRQTEYLCSILPQHAADFVIRSSNGEEFPVSRYLLMAHSPVFAAMLTHDSKEKEQSRCELDDVDTESVGILLDYVNGCGLAKVNDANAEKAMIMAVKYAIIDLRGYCEHWLANGVTEMNAAKYLALAEQLDLSVLKKAALFVIKRDSIPPAAADAALDKLTKASKFSQASIFNIFLGKM
ncbi:protein maternal effect lethal 26-like [Paramacrobiotus metropolitanus]|uniref:protein maternal effect lethal 26-like n=1 Tax=Paramacrobiotus metropolitanus TaxID=2943436 RepID=UPI002445B051|nr:protein maternal effect lethal 26-like [Paramacrobiotus metropolitanus]